MKTTEDGKSVLGIFAKPNSKKIQILGVFILGGSGRNPRRRRRGHPRSNRRTSQKSSVPSLRTHTRRITKQMRSLLIYVRGEWLDSFDLTLCRCYKQGNAILASRKVAKAERRGFLWIECCIVASSSLGLLALTVKMVCACGERTPETIRTLVLAALDSK